MRRPQRSPSGISNAVSISSTIKVQAEAIGRLLRDNIIEDEHDIQTIAQALRSISDLMSILAVSYMFLAVSV